MIFNLEKAQYHQDGSKFWCPSCRFKVMDPFHEVPEDGVLHCCLLGPSGCEFEVRPGLLAFTYKSGI